MPIPTAPHAFNLPETQLSTLRARHVAMAQRAVFLALTLDAVLDHIASVHTDCEKSLFTPEELAEFRAVRDCNQLMHDQILDIIARGLE